MTLLALLILPVLITAFGWVVFAVTRILAPAPGMREERDPLASRMGPLVRRPAPVGVREIREGQRRYQRVLNTSAYHYADAASDGLPEAWWEDLWRRRN